MLYQFQSDDGEVIERDYRMSNAPELGQKVTVNGKAYHRILSLPASVGLAEYDENDYPRVSRALPKFTKGCPLNEKGQPVILNKAHERRILKQEGYTREYSANDPPAA